MSIAQLWYLDDEGEWRLQITGAVCVLKNFREKNHSMTFLELQVNKDAKTWPRVLVLKTRWAFPEKLCTPLRIVEFS